MYVFEMSLGEDSSKYLVTAEDIIKGCTEFMQQTGYYPSRVVLTSMFDTVKKKEAKRE